MEKKRKSLMIVLEARTYWSWIAQRIQRVLVLPAPSLCKCSDSRFLAIIRNSMTFRFAAQFVVGRLQRVFTVIIQKLATPLPPVTGVGTAGRSTPRT